MRADSCNEDEAWFRESARRGRRRPATEAPTGSASDVDLVAAFDETRRISILDIVGMELELAELLGCKVDLVEEGTLKPRVQESVEAEAIRV